MVGAEGGQLAHVILIAAVDVLEVMHTRLAVGHDTREHEGRARPQIGGGHGRPLQMIDAAHDGVVVVQRHVGPHAHELGGEHEAVLEDVLRDDRHVIGQGRQQHELSLEIGGETRGAAASGCPRRTGAPRGAR